MPKSILKLETTADSPITFRTTIKTHHGRTLFLPLEINGSACTIIDCFYYDRNQGRERTTRYKARPKKLRTLQFPVEALLAVTEAELDKKFYGVEFVWKQGRQIFPWTSTWTSRPAAPTGNIVS